LPPPADLSAPPAGRRAERTQSNWTPKLNPAQEAPPLVRPPAWDSQEWAEALIRLRVPPGADPTLSQLAWDVLAEDCLPGFVPAAALALPTPTLPSNEEVARALLHAGIKLELAQAGTYAALGLWALDYVYTTLAVRTSAVKQPSWWLASGPEALVPLYDARWGTQRQCKNVIGTFVGLCLASGNWDKVAALATALVLLAHVGGHGLQPVSTQRLARRTDPLPLHPQAQVPL
jgi:hypothetical protein